MCNDVDPSSDAFVSELRITSPGKDILPDLVASPSVYLKERGSLDTLSLGDVVRGVVRGFDFGGFILVLVVGVDDDH